MEEQPATEANLKEIKLNEANLRDAKSKAEAKLAESKLLSISIAMFMAVVAMLGAVTAYRAALAEQDTLRSERRLQQGEMLELVKRQELLSKISSRTRYENSVAQHSPSADSDQGQAGSKPAPLDRRQAALKNLLAEEEAAHVRSLQPYLDYFGVDLPYPLEPSIAMHSAIFLRALGFDTVWGPPAADGSFPNIWEKLEADVTRGQTRVLRLAMAVVLFVLALAFLTFAQLSHNKPKHEKVLVWIGGLLALSGLVMAMLIDRAAWKDFVMFTAGFGVLALIGRPLARKFHFANGTEAGHKVLSPKPAGDAPSAEGSEEEEEEPVHPAEVDPALFAGMRLHVAPVAHTFGRFVISMIALSAVLSALSGYFYSHAAVKSSEATSAALADQAELFRLNSREVTVWNYMVGRVATAEDLHLRYEAARQRVQLAKEDPDLLGQKEMAEQEQQRRKNLEKFEKKEPQVHKLMTGELGPEEDVHFPRKMVITQSYHDPAKALAKWSADNEMSLGYQREATTFLALLTLFAIALYLLGQALGMGRTNAAFILVLFACGLVGVGVLRGLFIRFETKAIVLKPATGACRLPNEIDDKDLVDLAAEHFARGWVLYEGSSDDPGEMAKAAKEFGCAAEIRPTFAGADLYFARATNRANTPQLNEGGFFSLIAKNALGEVSRAERDARKLLVQQGFAPPMDLVGDVGFNTYADGLVKGDRDTVELGRQATVASLELDKTDLVTRFNLALAQMAEGNEKQALDTYSQTVTLGDPGKAPLVIDHGAEIGGAITDLDVFRQYCTGLNSAEYCKRFEGTDLPKLKSELVAATWPSAKGRTLAGSGHQAHRPRSVGLGRRVGLERPHGKPGPGRGRQAAGYSRRPVLRLQSRLEGMASAARDLRTGYARVVRARQSQPAVFRVAGQ